jgi:hypothetical protein
MSFEELAAEVNFFSGIVEREERLLAREEEDAIRRCLDAGAPDIETAKRWLEDAMWG